MNYLRKKILSALFLVIFFSFLISLIRQVLIYYRITRRLKEEREGLEVLEKKNLELKQRLEEVKNPEFLKGEAGVILGPGGQQVAFPKAPTVIETRTAEEPNYEKWLKLFLY